MPTHRGIVATRSGTVAGHSATATERSGTVAARSGIASTTQLRRLHVSAMVLGAVLFAVVGITGCRDLIQFTAGG